MASRWVKNDQRFWRELFFAVVATDVFVHPALPTRKVGRRKKTGGVYTPLSYPSGRATCQATFRYERSHLTGNPLTWMPKQFDSLMACGSFASTAGPSLQSVWLRHALPIRSEPSPRTLANAHSRGSSHWTAILIPVRAVFPLGYFPFEDTN